MLKYAQPSALLFLLLLAAVTGAQSGAGMKEFTGSTLRKKGCFFGPAFHTCKHCNHTTHISECPRFGGNGPSPRALHAAGLDETHTLMVVFGGNTTNGTHYQTQSFQTPLARTLSTNFEQVHLRIPFYLT